MRMAEKLELLEPSEFLHTISRYREAHENYYGYLKGIDWLDAITHMQESLENLEDYDLELSQKDSSSIINYKAPKIIGLS